MLLTCVALPTSLRAGSNTKVVNDLRPLMCASVLGRDLVMSARTTTSLLNRLPSSSQQHGGARRSPDKWHVVYLASFSSIGLTWVGAMECCCCSWGYELCSTPRYMATTHLVLFLFTVHFQVGLAGFCTRCTTIPTTTTHAQLGIDGGS